MTSEHREQAVVIQGSLPTPMLGVLHRPSKGVAPSGTGVVIVNGGAQYRAGAHRLFVQLARHLAARGHAVLRFDFPGQGDSPGDSTGFEDAVPHIGAAVDALHSFVPELRQCALMGLCDGASASLLYLDARKDQHITHIAALNPWVRSEVTAARAQVKHYYRQRLLMPDFWRKLFAGRVRWGAATELLCKVGSLWKTSTDTLDTAWQERMRQGLETHQGPICLVLGGADLVAQEFMERVQSDPRWRHSIQKAKVKLVHIPSADHTFCSAITPGEPDLKAVLQAWLELP